MNFVFLAISLRRYSGNIKMRNTFKQITLGNPWHLQRRHQFMVWSMFNHPLQFTKVSSLMYQHVFCIYSGMLILCSRELFMIKVQWVIGFLDMLICWNKGILRHENMYRLVQNQWYIEEKNSGIIFIIFRENIIVVTFWNIQAVPKVNIYHTFWFL